MKAYITKYALTAGIIETNQAEEYFSSKTNSLAIVANIGTPSYIFHRTEWQATKELAVARTNIMRHARIEALKKQIDRLERLVF